MYRVVQRFNVIVLCLVYLGTLEAAGMHDHAPMGQGVNVPEAIAASCSSAPAPDGPNAPTSHCALCVAGASHQAPDGQERLRLMIDGWTTIVDRPADPPGSSRLPALQRRGPPAFPA